ncbi:MAG: hypothetical protein ACLQIJ_01260 [Polyangia bacterium]
MKKLLALTVTLVLAALLTSCATTPPATDADRVGVFPDVSADKVFEAVKAALFDMKADIVAGSKESGFLNAREAINTTVATTILLGEAEMVYINYNIMFHADENGTKVQLKMIRAYENGTYPNEEPHAKYAEFWGLVNKYLGASAN